MEAATAAKTAVEDAQRESRRKREEAGERYVPRFFEYRDRRWVPKLVYVFGHHFHLSLLNEIYR
jgi:hypothetical protein